MKYTRNLIKFPIAIVIVGALVLFIDFVVIRLFDEWRELGGDSLRTSTRNTQDATLLLLESNQRALSLAKTPIGKLGPANTRRSNLRYYDTLYYTALQFGHDATSLIEVGCAAVPFIKYMDWVVKRTCVAPYYVRYDGKDEENTNTQLSGAHAIESVVADFMEYEVNDYSYDLLICSQVLEHVPDPSAFMKKLIQTAKTAIISVPYKWPDCGKSCNHKTDEISYDLLLEWSKPHEPIYSSIVQERLEGKRDSASSKRMILVFQKK